MAQILTYLTFLNNKTKTKKILHLAARYKGTTRYVFHSVNNLGLGHLTEPDEKHWDKDSQRFYPDSPACQQNNALLDLLMRHCNNVLKYSKPETISQFWELLEKAIRGKLVSPNDMTFGWFLRSLIDEMKGGQQNKLPSSNYQVYNRLLHHLEREDVREDSKHILNVKVHRITDREFQWFGEYLRSLPNPNYMCNMKYFKRAMKLALKKGYTRNVLNYSFAEDAPAKTFDDIMKMSQGISSLSHQQIDAIEHMDVSDIVLRCKENNFYKQLYVDSCLLMYYLYSRPIDIFNMKVSNIRVCEKGFFLEYLPIKKKNNIDPTKAIVRVPICKKAWAIIQKYKDMSPAGYLLPFSENKREWNLSDPAQYHTRYNRTNCMLGKVNVFLKKVAEKLDISFINDTLTMYVFRHTAITHAIADKKVPPMVVAKMAGTSVREIERSYIDHTANMFDYIE